VTLLIAGDGPLHADLAALARELSIDDSVHFLGWRTDVQRVLSCIDVYCLSSLWEALPFALLEAMAMSRPIVATSVDGVPEIVVDGETGFLAPPRQPRVLAEGLIKLVREAPDSGLLSKRAKGPRVLTARPSSSAICSKVAPDFTRSARALAFSSAKRRRSSSFHSAIALSRTSSSGPSPSPTGPPSAPSSTPMNARRGADQTPRAAK